MHSKSNCSHGKGGSSAPFFCSVRSLDSDEDNAEYPVNQGTTFGFIEYYGKGVKGETPMPYIRGALPGPNRRSLAPQPPSLNPITKGAQAIGDELHGVPGGEEATHL